MRLRIRMNFIQSKLKGIKKLIKFLFTIYNLTNYESKGNLKEVMKEFDHITNGINSYQISRFCKLPKIFELVTLSVKSNSSTFIADDLYGDIDV